METLLKRLIYRSKHRGNKEMDFVLGRFADEGIKALNNNELELYSELLEESDNDLWEWVSGQQQVPSKYEALIGKIGNGQ